jgi:hypothetical protein
MNWIKTFILHLFKKRNSRWRQIFQSTAHSVCELSHDIFRSVFNNSNTIFTVRGAWPQFLSDFQIWKQVSPDLSQCTSVCPDNISAQHPNATGEGSRQILTHSFHIMYHNHRRYSYLECNLRSTGKKRRIISLKTENIWNSGKAYTSTSLNCLHFTKIRQRHAVPPSYVRKVRVKIRIIILTRV